MNVANELAGEKFSIDTKVTQLSGGQSRALMIADTAYMSSSPVILIDEIENAGIDRRQAISILTRKDKIVFMSTHDPLLCAERVEADCDPQRRHRQNHRDNGGRAGESDDHRGTGRHDHAHTGNAPSRREDHAGPAGRFFAVTVRDPQSCEPQRSSEEVVGRKGAIQTERCGKW